MSTETIERKSETSPADQYLADVWATAKGERPNDPPGEDVLFGAGRFPDQFAADVQHARDRLRAVADLAKADELWREAQTAKPQRFAPDTLLGTIRTLGELHEALHYLTVIGHTRIEDQIAEVQRENEARRLRAVARHVLHSTAARSLHNRASTLAAERCRLQKDLLPEKLDVEIEQAQRSLELATDQGRREAMIEARKELLVLRERETKLDTSKTANVETRRKVAKVEAEIAAVETRMLDPLEIELCD